MVSLPLSSRNSSSSVFAVFFFFNDTATTEIYTLSLHDALPISSLPSPIAPRWPEPPPYWQDRDRKSTRLNSSHVKISYAVFCLKKKKTKNLTDVMKKNEILNERSNIRTD